MNWHFLLRRLNAQAALAGVVMTLVLLHSCAGGKSREPAPIPAQSVQFDTGSHSATIKGELHGPGLDTRDYVVRAKAGQKLTVALQTESIATYFNVLIPDGDAAMFTGQLDGGAWWSGELPLDGLYKIRVYLTRAASRDGAAADFTLKVDVQ